MRLNPGAAQRLLAAKMRADGVTTIFEVLLQMAEEFGVESATVTLDYEGRDDDWEPGDLVPVITLSLRAVEPRDVRDDNNLPDDTASGE